MYQDREIIECITKLVDKHVPRGIEPVLYVDRRKVMKVWVMKMLEKGVIPFDEAAIITLCKNWEIVLYQRAAYVN